MNNNENEKGFSTPQALAFIFSLCLMTLTFCIAVASSEKKINSYKKRIDAQKDAASLIFEITKSLQELKESQADFDGSAISSLIENVCGYDFSIQDVSTKINRNFWSEKILKDSAISEYLAENEKDETAYSWINPNFADAKITDDVIKDFEEKNTFPLINTFPPLNIHFMSEDFIKAVFTFYGIKEIDRKVKALKEKSDGQTSVKELSSLLELGENHPLFDLIGFKTSFWKLDFETDKCRCSAIFAAVPDRDSQRKIEKYILVEKEILYKGGAL